MRSLVVANWKMNPTTWAEAKRLFEVTRKASDAAKNVTLVVAPPSIYVREIIKLYKGRRIAFAVQNAHYELSGSFTGEISFAQAKDARISYALIGHAERRALGESNEDTRKKVSAALQMRITPILCVGEQARSQSGEYFNVIRDQLRTGLADVPAGKISSIIIGYEPVWAIGGSKPMSSGEMHEMAIFIRKALVELHGATAMKVKILYGGSIDDTTALDMLENGDVDGLIPGRASSDVHKIAALLSSIA